ncbi:(Na+)-NQR maturation NqrM [Cardiobacteriaceae bacterium TAE3-ERU3]|nr:(Na+)-NQR maturation NqrM [Cardiobacteriaceae bacterium TAE3-ERU3]
MFTVFIVVFSVMMLTVVIMAVGVIFGRAPIKGSCGGLNNVGVERACGCTEVCEQENAPLKVEAADEGQSPEVYRP